MEPTKEEIIKAIKNSGYLFEQQVAKIVEKHSYDVTPNYNFEDSDTGESREIDVYAFLRSQQRSLDVWLNQILLIECKNIDSPIVFFSKPGFKRHSYTEGYFEICGMPEVLLEENKMIGVPLESYLNISALSHRYHIKSPSAQFCLISKNKKNKCKAHHEPIYTGGILPIIKCLSYMKKFVHARKDFIGIDLVIIYPIVVVSSPIYMMDPETEIIEKVEWIFFHRHYQSKRDQLIALIDFVNINYFPKYLNTITNSFNKVYDCLWEKKDELLKYIKKKNVSFKAMK